MKTRVGFVIGLCLLGLASCKPQSNSVIAFYTFDRNTLDSTIHHNNATPVGKIEYGADRFGQPGKALFLEGHAYLTVPDAPDLRLGTGTPFTISAWVRTRDSAVAGIIRKGPMNADAPGYILELRHGHLHAAITATGGNVDLYDSLHFADDNRWHLITLIGASDSVNLYLDTTLVASRLGANITPATGNTLPVVIGIAADSSLVDRTFLDQVFIAFGKHYPHLDAAPVIAHNMPGYPSVVGSPAGGMILGMCWTDVNTGYYCAAGGIVAATISGSNPTPSWTEQTDATTVSLGNNLRRISFSGSNGVAVGDNGTIIIRSGASWRVPNSITSPAMSHSYVTLSDVKFLSDGSLVAVGGFSDDGLGWQGFVLTLVNAGLDWTDAGYSGREVYCVTPSQVGGYQIGAADGIYAVDGSGVWSNPLPTTGLVLSINIGSDNNGFAVTTDKKVFYWNEGSWGLWTNPSGFPTFNSLYAAVAIGGTNVLIGGDPNSGNNSWYAPTTWSLTANGHSGPWGYMSQRSPSSVLLIQDGQTDAAFATLTTP